MDGQSDDDGDLNDLQALAHQYVAYASDLQPLARGDEGMIAYMQQLAEQFVVLTHEPTDDDEEARGRASAILATLGKLREAGDELQRRQETRNLRAEVQRLRAEVKQLQAEVALWRQYWPWMHSH